MAQFPSVLAEVAHRLEQLTNPTFDRGTVAALIAEFKVIEAGSYALLQELQDEVDGYEAELAEDSAAMERAMATIDRLTQENRKLSEQLSSLDGPKLAAPPPVGSRLSNSAMMARLEAIQRRLHAESPYTRLRLQPVD